jgi:hypothetical protein
VFLVCILAQVPDLILFGLACACLLIVRMPLAIMSDERRPKRKAAAAALDAIFRIKEQEEATETDDAIPFDEEQDDLVQPILFCGGNIDMPKHLFVGEILDFLSKPDLVHCASLVSSTWCKATKDTILWNALDEDIWKKYPRRRNGGTPAKRVFPSMQLFYAFLPRS